MPRKSGVPSGRRGGEKGAAFALAAGDCAAALYPAAPMPVAAASAAAAIRAVNAILFMLARGVAFRARVVVDVALAFMAIVVDDLIGQRIALQIQVHRPGPG